MPTSLTLPVPGASCFCLSPEAEARLRDLRLLFLTLSCLNDSPDRQLAVPAESLMASFALFAELMDVPMAECPAAPETFLKGA